MTLALILIIAFDLAVLTLLGLTMGLPFRLREASAEHRAKTPKPVPVRRTHRFSPEGAKQAPSYRDPATVDA